MDRPQLLALLDELVAVVLDYGEAQVPQVRIILLERLHEAVLQALDPDLELLQERLVLARCEIKVCDFPKYGSLGARAFGLFLRGASRLGGL